ncbi:MAG: DUF3298 domain-containing protein [Clostridia bacterium]|nr:DUF3298 domain-containing protein [Clostridia bacterium]
MKKITALLLAFALLFGFAACNGGKPQTPDTSQGTTTNSVTDKENKNPDNTLFNLIDIYAADYNKYEWDNSNNILLSNVNVQTLHLSDEASKKYPKLDNAFKKLNEEKTELADEELESITGLALDYLSYGDSEYFNGYTYESCYYLQRADEMIVSVRSDWSSFSGGVHPNYGAAGYNFDSKTGEEIRLSDVVNDTSVLPKLIADNIKAQEVGEYLGSLEDMLKDYKTEDFSWTVNYQSITFYFSPYDIASFAAGLITATFYFDDYPELFNEKYTEAPASYAIALPANNDISVDLNGKDGKKDVLSYNANFESEDQIISSITVNLNGKQFDFDGLEAFEDSVYLVFIQGHYYIYYNIYGFNDYSEILVLELTENNIKESDVFFNGKFDYFYIYGEGENEVYTAKLMFNNPAEFTLTSRCDLLGTYMGRKTYLSDPETGMPESAEKSYKVEFYTEFTLVSKIPLSVKMLPGEREETLPAGTGFEIIGTDGKNYVDTRLADDRECRIYASRNNDEYDYDVYINGVSEYDVFEEIMYAG